MREVLFRGKRCDNGEWVQGFYVKADHHWHKNGIHKDWIALGASANGGWFALHNKYAVKSETVGQFTGLTDKNGKKIFEGDIFCDLYGCMDGIPRMVRWDEAHMEFKCPLVRKHWAYGNNDSSLWIQQNSNIEVIGNVHDNPELLENP